MDRKIILIKLGGSVITDKNIPYKARPDVIRRLAKEIKKVKNFSIVLAHGSGSFGHTSAKKFGGKKGYESRLGIARVARDAMEINRIVMDILIDVGLPAVSLRPMSMLLTSAGKIKDHFFKIVEEVINQDLIPVIYGDVIWDKKWKSTIYSGEKTLSELGAYLIKRSYSVNKIIQVGETNGVYGHEGNTIREINKKNWENVRPYVFKSEKADVTGGMKHKIENALQMADKGIRTFLISGKIDNELTNAIQGRNIQGTIIQ